MTALQQVIDTAAFWWLTIIGFFSFLWLHGFWRIVKHNDRTLARIVEEREHLAADRRLVDWLDFEDADDPGHKESRA